MIYSFKLFQYGRSKGIRLLRNLREETKGMRSDRIRQRSLRQQGKDRLGYKLVPSFAKKFSYFRKLSAELLLSTS
jgi:hypothetical protein